MFGEFDSIDLVQIWFCRFGVVNWLWYLVEKTKKQFCFLHHQNPDLGSYLDCIKPTLLFRNQNLTGNTYTDTHTTNTNKV